MNARFLDIELTANWKHFVISFAALMIVTVVLALITAFVNAALGTDEIDDLTRILGFFMIPLFAYTVLQLSKYFKLNNDVEYCRSIVLAEFVLGLAVLVIVFIAALYTLIYDMVSFVLNTAAGVLSAVAGSMVTYIWLIIFLKRDIPMKRILPLAALFAIAMWIFVYGGYYIMPRIEGMTSISDYTAEIMAVYSIQFGIEKLFFAIPLLYYMTGKKINKYAQLFAALMIISSFIYHLVALLNSFGGYDGLINFISVPLSLVLIYWFSRKKED